MFGAYPLAHKPRALYTNDLDHIQHHERQYFNYMYRTHASDRGEPGGDVNGVCSDGFSLKKTVAWCKHVS